MQPEGDLKRNSRAVYILAACVFVSMLGLGIIGPIIPLYAQSMGATFAFIGLLSSAWSMSRLAFSVPVGRLSDLRSKKKLMMLGVSIYTFVSILYVLAMDVGTLLAIRLVHGLGSALTMPVAMAYAAGLAQEGHEGSTLGTMTMAMFAGFSLGPFIGGGLSDLFSLTFPFYVMCALSATSFVLMYVFLPEEVHSQHEKPRPSYRKVLYNPTMRAAFVYRLIVSLGMGSVFGFLAIYISSEPTVGGLGLTVATAGMIMSVGQVASSFLQKPFGLLADRYNKTLLTAVGGVVSSIGLILFLYTSGAYGTLLAQLVFSLGGALSMPALSAIVAIEGREIGLGTTMSVMEAAMSLGMIIGPLVSGVIVDLFSLKPIFLASAAITALGTATFYILMKSKR